MPAPEPDAPTFTVAVQGGAPRAVVAGDGGALVLARDVVVELQGSRARVVRAPYGPYEWIDPAAPPGFPPPPFVSCAGGRWPEAVLTAERAFGGGAFASAAYLWGEGRWSEAAIAGRDAYPESEEGRLPDATFKEIVPWTPGAMLGLANANSLGAPYVGISLHAFAPTSRPLPVPARPAPGAGGAPNPCLTRLGEGSALATLPSGEVLVVGSECGAGALSVEAWAPGEVKGKLQRLPPTPAGAPTEASAAAAVSPTEIYIGGARRGAAYLAAFDGQAWRAVDAPMRRGIRAMASRPGGSVWATTVDGELWRKPPARPWTRVDLGGRRARAVSLGGPAEVWVLTDDAVLRSTAGASIALPAAPEPECPSIWVQLASVTPPQAWGFSARYADDRETFPRTRAAVAGHEELAAARFLLTADWNFGALVPDQATARRLIEVLRPHLSGVPQVQCVVPMARRELRFDLRTGAQR